MNQEQIFYISEPISTPTYSPPQDYSITNSSITKLYKVVITEPNEKQKAFFDEIDQHPKLVGNFNDNDYMVGNTVEEIIDELSKNFDFWFKDQMCLLCHCEDCDLEKASLFFDRF